VFFFCSRAAACTAFAKSPARGTTAPFRQQQGPLLTRDEPATTHHRLPSLATSYDPGAAAAGERRSDHLLPRQDRRGAIRTHMIPWQQHCSILLGTATTWARLSFPRFACGLWIGVTNLSSSTATWLTRIRPDSETLICGRLARPATSDRRPQEDASKRLWMSAGKLGRLECARGDRRAFARGQRGAFQEDWCRSERAGKRQVNRVRVPTPGVSQ